MLCAVLLVSQATLPSSFLRYPDIHGNQVVFTSEGDLWLGDLSTGEASRLTSDAGTETNPTFAPDGRTIAFVGEYDGERQAYTIPTTGGAPTKLTNVPNFRIVTNWTPDGKNVVFRVAQSPTPYAYYTAPIAGGIPTKLPLEFASHVWMGLQQGDFVFTRFARWYTAWFRYVGGMENQIWTYRSGKFQQITNLKGTCEYPVWAGDRIYFAHEEKARFSLMSVPVDGGKPRIEVDDSPFEIRELSTDGKRIVYESGQGADVFDIQTHKVSALQFHLVSDLIHTRPLRVPVQKNVGSYSLTPTGKRVLMESRGQIVNLPVDEGEAKVWKSKPGVRFRYPAMSPDAKQIAYVSDLSGQPQLWIANADGTGETQITHDQTGQIVQVTWTPDSKSIVMYDSQMHLRVINLLQKTDKLLVTARASWGAPPFDISPDSRWIATIVAAPVTEYGVLSLYHVTTGKSHIVSTGVSNEIGVAFSQDGRYLVVTSNRNLSMVDDPLLNQGNFSNPVTVTLLPLAEDVPDPLALTDPAEVPKVTEPPKAIVPAKPAETPKPTPPFNVDFTNIWDRRVDLPIPPGNYQPLAMAGGKIWLIDGPSLKSFELTTKISTTVSTGTAFQFSADYTRILISKGPELTVLDPSNGTSKPVVMGNLSLHVVPTSEWKQIFWDAWRLLRDYFYVANMNGVNWQAIGDKYAALLPQVRSRDELDELIRWMQSELGSSHEYLVAGDGQDIKTKSGTPGLGIDLAADPSGFLKIVNIIRGDGFLASERSPLLGPGKNVAEGMFLIEVAGVSVRENSDPYAPLVNRAGETVSIKVNDKPSETGARSVLVKPVANENRMRYVDWVEGNRKYVEKATGGKIGYIHMAAMGAQDLQDFVKQYMAQRDRDALIIDDRYNNGGYVQEYINRILGSRLSGFFNLRNSDRGFTRQRDFFNGPMACLINEFDISCGEEFPYRFRELHLGPLIGRRTMGGEVGSDPGWPLIDGGKVYVPDYGFWTPGKGWQIEGGGVSPDIDVPSSPSEYLAHRDPQIDKAIEILLKKIPAHPPRNAPQPPDRDRVHGG